jgi:hypothetical protein
MSKEQKIDWDKQDGLPSTPPDDLPDNVKAAFGAATEAYEAFVKADQVAKQAYLDWYNSKSNN